MKKPFDLEAAKRGEPFESASGKKAIEFHIFGNAIEDHKLAVLFENKMIITYRTDGKDYTGIQSLFMSEPELKPCPFCGNEDIHLDVNVNNYYFVTCENCYSGTPVGEKQEVIDTWNERSEPKNQWQPIETAPKDGSLILGCKDYENGVKFYPNHHEIKNDSIKR